jgi:two-component system chemotaxis response regulator CheB
VYRGNIIIIGASTGGPKTLDKIFTGLPALDAAVLIVQHIAPPIDAMMAKRLNTRTAMDVCLPERGDLLRRGRIYVAPSRIHLKLVSNGRIDLSENGKVSCCRPCIDVAMGSVAEQPGRVVGVILTGMGYDGAEGIAHLKSIGGVTIAQDEETSTIYGMPRAARETGKVDFGLPHGGIGQKLISLVGRLEVSASR